MSLDCDSANKEKPRDHQLHFEQYNPPLEVRDGDTWLCTRNGVVYWADCLDRRWWDKEGKALPVLFSEETRSWL